MRAFSNDLLKKLKKTRCVLFPVLCLLPLLSPPVWATNFSLDLEDLARGIEAARKKVEDQIRENPNATRVLVLGLTGSGKSTLVHALAGKDLNVAINKGGSNWDVTVDPRHLIPGYEIGSGLSSVTTTPCSYYDHQSNLVYWDCPGFLDSRGPKQELVNAFAVNQILKSPSRVKILLAMHETDFQNARGNGALDRIEKLIGLMPEIDQLKQSLCFVATCKADQFPTKNKMNKLLADVKVEEDSASQGLADLRRRGFPDDSDEVQDLLEKKTLLAKDIDLLSSLQRSDNIFSFPAPNSVGPYPPDLFSDRNSIIRGLQINPVSNPVSAFSLEPNVVLAVMKMVHQFGDTSGVLYRFIKDMRKSYRENKSPDLLKSHQILLERLIDGVGQGTTTSSFAVQLEGLIQDNAIDAAIKPILHGVSTQLIGAQAYVDFAQSLGLPITNVNVLALLEPSLKEIHFELTELLKHEQFLVEHSAQMESLAAQVQEEKERGLINQEEAKKRIAQIEEQAKTDKKNAEIKITEILQEQEKARLKASQDLKEALAETKTQYESKISDLTKKIDDMNKKESSSESTITREMALLNLMALSGRNCPQPAPMQPMFSPFGMGGGGGYPFMPPCSPGGFDPCFSPSSSSSSSFCGSSGGTRRSASSSSSPSRAGMTYVSAYTRSNGTHVDGYWRSAPKGRK